MLTFSFPLSYESICLILHLENIKAIIYVLDSTKLVKISKFVRTMDLKGGQLMS